MFSNAFLLVFAIAFMGCVLSTPLVTRLAAWFGAIDRPDQFRRIHKGATPRMGGLGVAFGLGVGILPVALGGYLRDWPGAAEWWGRQWAVIAAAAIIILVGILDDTRGLNPRPKLLGQTGAVLVLILGGIQIQKLAILGITLDLSYPAVLLPIPNHPVTIGLPGALLTIVWFLGCMNIWNLIDGMDGLASGVGLLVSGTLMLVAIQQNNIGSALLAASLAGSLAGFLLYNWHPAVIFLGDTGSLLIGLLIGVIGVQDSLKGPSAVSILFPILAMGLPISDTAMAIFRRWVRNLPLSSADRRHVHHLLIGLGLNPRQAALMLYCFSGFLCGAVLLGVALNNEMLALVLGLSGCLAFLLVLTSRRDELALLRQDLRLRMTRGKQERFAAKATWESIQRIELCEDLERVWQIVLDTTATLGCDALRLSCHRNGRAVFVHSAGEMDGADANGQLSGPTASFRLSCGQDLLLSIALHQADDSPVAADIAFRFLQRLSLATAERIERLLGSTESATERPRPLPVVAPAVAALKHSAPLGRPAHDEADASEVGAVDSGGWLRRALGWTS